jgi:hypothetical protein
VERKMSLSLISTEKMVTLTQYWIKDERATLEKIPQAAGLLVNLDSLFKRLFVAAESHGAASDTTREIYLRQVATDRTHDQILRGSYYAMTAQSHFLASLGEEDGSKLLLKLRDYLYPDGLSGTSLSYDEEAGAAELLERRLTDDIITQLTHIVAYQDEVRTLTLYDQITKQIALAKELRELEQEKKKAEAAVEANPAPSKGDARKIRLEWMDTVRTLERSLRAARRAGNTDEATENKLLKDLREAADDAHKKYTEDKKKAEESQKL